MLFLKDLKYLTKKEYIHYIWEAIMSMNSYKLDSLLKDNINYEDIGKVRFIEKLSSQFTLDQSQGDNEYFMDFDNCNVCNCNETVCKFIGNVSGNTFALYFEFKDDYIVDIYHCNSFGIVFYDNIF